MNRELYQDLILEHFRSPRCKHAMDASDPGVVELRNPHCGDLILLRVSTDCEGRLRWEHNASGCAASVASTSILCELLQGLSAGDALARIRDFLNALEDPLTGAEATIGTSPLREDLHIQALLFFRTLPARKHCVSLAWICAENALAALPHGQ